MAKDRMASPRLTATTRRIGGAARLAMARNRAIIICRALMQLWLPTKSGWTVQPHLGRLDRDEVAAEHSWPYPDVATAQDRCGRRQIAGQKPSSKKATTRR